MLIYTAKVDDTNADNMLPALGLMLGMDGYPIRINQYEISLS